MIAMSKTGFAKEYAPVGEHGAPILSFALQLTVFIQTVI
jgi:hypothetical protein